MKTYSKQEAPRNLFRRQMISSQEEYFANLLENDNRFNLSASYREQVYWACVILRDENREPVSFDVIGSFFQVSRKTIQTQYERFKSQPQISLSMGRPRLLSDPQWQRVFDFINDNFNRRQPCTLSRIREYIYESFGAEISTDSLRHIIHKNKVFKTAKGIPMEDLRLNVTIEDIRTYFEYLKKSIYGVPNHFIYNMDELGHQIWADRKSKVVVIPRICPEKKIHIPVPRQGKRITLIVAVSASGRYTKPFFIIPRKTYDVDLHLFGIDDYNVEIKYQTKGFVDRDIVEYWFSSIFLPEIRQNQKTFNYNGKTILILDNCTCHNSDYIDDICFENNIELVFLPPHSSNQLQVLDVSLFGLLKRRIENINSKVDINIQSKHIAQIYSALQSSFTSQNIIASFRNAGMELYLENSTCFVSVNELLCHCLLFDPKLLIESFELGSDDKSPKYSEEDE
jgi:transposase